MLIRVAVYTSQTIDKQRVVFRSQRNEDVLKRCWNGSTRARSALYCCFDKDVDRSFTLVKDGATSLLLIVTNSELVLDPLSC